MGEFEPKKFLKTEVTRARVVKLDRQELWKVIEYLELEVSEEAKKPELMLSILVSSTPALLLRQRDCERAHERQQKEQERQEKESEAHFR